MPARAGHASPSPASSRSTPVAVIGLTNVVAVAAAEDHTCALRSDATVRCWGRNTSGQLGDGTKTTRLTPAGVSGLTTAVAIPALTSFFHTCALRVDGAPVCWGGNSFGQLGNGTTTDRLTAVEVPSFRANIDEIAILAFNGQRILLTALVWRRSPSAGHRLAQEGALPVVPPR